MEWEIPIPTKKDGTADFKFIARVWYDAVELIQDWRREGRFAVDMTLEMRVMGGSDVTMAPYKYIIKLFMRSKRHMFGCMCLYLLRTR